MNKQTLIEGKPVTEQNLHAECIARGIPVSNHESDLYIPATDETQALVRHFQASRPSLFVNQVEGGTWLDVPFAFQPFWDRVQAESERRAAHKKARETENIS